MPVDFDQLTEALAAGAALSGAQLRELAQSRDLIGLGMLAADVRTRLHGARGTFVRVEMLPVPVSVEGWNVALTAEAGEARLVGAPGTLAHAVATVAAVRTLTTGPISGFALDDLEGLGPALVETLSALRGAGLDAVAAARVDRLDLERLHAVAGAGLVLQSVTLGAPVDGDALLDQLEDLRAWQAATGVVRGCVPLPVETAPDQPTTGYDDMRHVALARLVLDNVAHVQAHWGRMGAKLSQSCLLFGANDIDAVPARDDMPHGPRRAIVEEVRRNVIAASLEPVERDGHFAVRTMPVGQDSRGQA